MKFPGVISLQVDDGRLVLDRSHERLEHEIEAPRGGKRALHSTRGALRVWLARRSANLRIIGAEPALAVAAIDERIGENLHVAARLPHARVHEDRRVEPFHVVARAHHRVPPPVLQILLELDA